MTNTTNSTKSVQAKPGLIRWPGLAAFIVISALIATLTLVFLDTWIKIVAETALEEVNGAEVNIGQVNHSWSPFGVVLRDLQITDPASPENNKVQADEINALIALAPILRHKVIIDELNVIGVQFNQARQSKGAVYRIPEEEQTESIKESIKQDLKDIPVPSVDQILANSPLKTTQAIDEVNNAYQRHKDQLAKQYKSLPSKDKLASYKKRIKSITDTDYKDPIKLAEAKKEFDQLKAEIKQDKEQLTAFKQAASEARQDLAPKLSQLKAAPGQDYDLLKSLITGDTDAIQNVTAMVFGDKAAKWSEYILSAYQIVAPMLQKKQQETVENIRSEGRWIAFDDTTNDPDFLIKHAAIAVTWQTESILSDWQNITHQHEKLGKATTFLIDSKNSKLWQSLQIQGDFRFSPAGMQANQEWALQGVSLNNTPMLEQQKLSTTLNSGLLASNGKVSINNGAIQGGGNIDLSKLALSASGSNNLTKVIAETLVQLKTLSIKGDLSGSFDKPDLSIKSDLDKQFANAMLNSLTSDQNSQLAELKQKLNAKIDGALGEGNSGISQFIDWEKLAEGDLSNLNEMLEAKMDSVIDKEKDKLKNKLKDKLFGG